MRQLQTRHILLFRILRDRCSFLTRRQIERVLTLSRISTTKTLLWLLSEQYLNRRYRADSFAHFQTPVYYLGKRGWHVVGKPVSEYSGYRLQIGCEVFLASRKRFWKLMMLVSSQASTFEPRAW